MMSYRRRAATVCAVQFDPNTRPWFVGIQADASGYVYSADGNLFALDAGDWLVFANGTTWVVEDDAFGDLYEAVEDE